MIPGLSGRGEGVPAQRDTVRSEPSQSPTSIMHQRDLYTTSSLPRTRGLAISGPGTSDYQIPLPVSSIDPYATLALQQGRTFPTEGRETIFDAYATFIKGQLEMGHGVTLTYLDSNIRSQRNINNLGDAKFLLTVTRSSNLEGDPRTPETYQTDYPYSLELASRYAFGIAIGDINLELLTPEAVRRILEVFYAAGAIKGDDIPMRGLNADNDKAALKKIISQGQIYGDSGPKVSPDYPVEEYGDPTKKIKKYWDGVLRNRKGPS